MLLDLDLSLLALLVLLCLVLVGVLTARWWQRRRRERLQRTAGQRALRRFD